MRTARTVVAFCAFILVALPGAADLAAQQPTTSPASLVTKSIKVDLIVTDENGGSIDDIKVEDLELKVDGELQNISYFARVEKPVISVLAVDTSMSFRPLLPYALGAVRLLIESHRPNDETMLIRFASSDYIETVVPFTPDRSVLLNVEMDKFSAVGGQSAVLDALYLAAEGAGKHKPTDSTFRRAAVLISDGEDRASYYSLSKITKLLNELNVQVFLIGLTSALNENRGLISLSPRKTAETLLT